MLFVACCWLLFGVVCCLMFADACCVFVVFFRWCLPLVVGVCDLSLFVGCCLVSVACCLLFGFVCCVLLCLL